MFVEQRKELVKDLKKHGYIKSKELEKAFLETPRELFVNLESEKEAYIDTPLSIGSNQTISAPHMVAIMCESLDIKKDQKILEIGSGSGYHSAVVSKLVGNKGFVYSIERISFLADFAKKNLEKANIKNVNVLKGDGSEGLEKNAPYDRIYVTCASPTIPPPLIEQLKNYGKLLIPVGSHICDLKLIERIDDNISEKSICGCAFVPLIGKYGHKLI